MPTRAFLAIALDDGLRGVLAQSAAAVRKNAPTWRGEKWVSAQNLHVTLAFLGLLEPPALDAAQRLAETVCNDHSPYTLGLARVIPAPRPRSASMLWATVSDGYDETSELADELATRLVEVGYEPPAREFTPHITLVRARRPRPVPSLALDAANDVIASAEPLDLAMSVQGVTVYSSTLTPQGPVYDQLAFLPLRGD
ncbi:MAG: RNA 2',3'-cyclic phosphodiesterase [Actinomycetia bacterium]|nr:RNA 2',3'-cyclic phosphodiesterase [Actinomycetes bacterium]